ncbi:MAG: hypothetical protein K0M70_01935 [Arenimonas sp.]|uniref:hypothetical protein n=1 Tax=Arenimonas sp. TaxID=1872635 RepID=UPI0025BB3DE5|nr:hypothetical protein [Arenimonas sp.]MBW8366602.1 hypothetical protein [Arenimonas sp.]
MDTMLIGGMVAVFSALPGLGLGLALLMGKWRPASLANSGNPDRMRVALGTYLIAVDALVLLLGIGVMVLPEARVISMVPYAVGAVVLVSTLGMLPLLRAARA